MVVESLFYQYYAINKLYNYTFTHYDIHYTLRLDTYLYIYTILNFRIISYTDILLVISLTLNNFL